MMSMVPEDDTIYLSFDSLEAVDSDINSLDNIHTPEFLNTIVASGIPNHLLRLKVGVK